jgi:hypothetical protein
VTQSTRNSLHLASRSARKLSWLPVTIGCGFIPQPSFLSHNLYMAKPKKSRLWTNADLREWFDTYNERYFGGKLECPHISFSVLEGLGKTTRIRVPGRRRSKNDQFTIRIHKSQRSSRRQAAMSLLHEMCHLEDRCRHSCGLRGRYFNRRMQQLAAAGAFFGIW